MSSCCFTRDNTNLRFSVFCTSSFYLWVFACFIDMNFVYISTNLSWYFSSPRIKPKEVYFLYHPRSSRNQIVPMVMWIYLINFQEIQVQKAKKEIMKVIEDITRYQLLTNLPSYANYHLLIIFLSG